MHFPKLNYKSLCEDLVLPQMVKVRQDFPENIIDDPAAHLDAQLNALGADITDTLKGKRIGITAGSRGLPHYKEILKALCDKLKEWGAEPFIFPSMGSHAGATAEGQKEHLRQFGVCEEYLGVPVLSSMEVVTVKTLEDGFPVYCDKYAYEADGIILFNKIKPHTHFKYKYESGLLKMACIGAGKHKGADAFHSRGYDDFGPNLERVGKAFLEGVNVIFAVGMLQSPSDLIGHLEVIRTEDIFRREAELQERAKREMPRLKLPRIDVLIIDEIGKEISGTGCDPNVTGRTERASQQPAFKAIAPDIEKLVLLDITEAAHGNATGAGAADVISYRFVNKMDFSSTYTNVITAKSFRIGAMPLYANSDKDAIKLAVAHSFLQDTSKAKIVRIKNTLELTEIECSVGCLPEIERHEDMQVLSDPYDWEWNGEGNLW